MNFGRCRKARFVYLNAAQVTFITLVFVCRAVLSLLERGLSHL